MKTLILGFILLLAGLTSKAQCSLNKKTYLPKKDAVASEGYGMTVSVYKDIMVVGSSSNDSLAADCGMAFVYQLTPDNRWQKIAELVPSDPTQYRSFGSYVFIHENTIGIMGASSVIYIFEKQAGDNWISGTESYQMKSPGTLNSYGKFVIKGDELTVLAYRRSEIGLEVFNKIGGVFDSIQFIKSPNTPDNFGSGIDDFAVGDNFVVMTCTNYRAADLSTDARASVFEKNGSLYNQTPSAILKPSDAVASQATSWRGFVGFGTGVSTAGSTIFVTASAHLINDSDFNQGLYVFEKPLTGWTDAIESYSTFVDGNSWYSNRITVNENYVITSGGALSSATGYKKIGLNWSDGIQTFKIDHPTPGKNFGYQIALTDKHLVISSPADYTAGTKEPDIIFDYYTSSNNWENSINPTNLITETEVNATYDFFGNSLSSYGNLLMIGSPFDDEKGIDAGVIYIYEKDKPDTSIPVKLFAPQIKGNSQFGSSMITGDSMLFVGAVGEGYNTGRVYIFKLNSNQWVYHSQLAPTEMKSDSYFGSSIAYYNGYLAIAEFNNGPDEFNGYVNIYKKDSNGFFQFLTTLRPSYDERSNAFGRSIVMNDSIIAIGSGVTNGFSIYYEPKVFLFKKKTEWNNDYEVATLQPSVNYSFNDFGCSMSMQGDYIVIGSSRDLYDFNDQNTIGSGSAYIFKKPLEGWKGNINEVARLLPSDPVKYGSFGYSVSIDNDDILAGAPNAIRFRSYPDMVNDTELVKPGKVYHYIRPENEWLSTNKESNQIVSDRNQSLNAFGSALLIADRTAYTGAFYDNTNSGFRSGSVQAQKLLPTIGNMYTLCEISGPIQLKAYPSGGTWSGDGISTTGLFNPSIARAGSHLINYTFEGCAVSKSIEVKNFNVSTSFTSPPLQLMCKKESIDISLNTNIDSIHYNWFYRGSLNDQYSSVKAKATTIHANKTGYYQVRIDDSFCPSYYQYFEVQNYPDVDVRINTPPALCPNSVVKLGALPTGGVWSGSGITNQGILNTSSLNGGSYKVMYVYTNSRNCVYKDSTMLRVEPVVDININAEPVICNDEVATLHATPAGGTWFGQGITTLGNVNPVSLGNGIYKMIYKITTSKGCTFKDSTNLSIDKLELPLLRKESGYVCKDSPSTLSLPIDDQTSIQWVEEPTLNVIGTDKTLKVVSAGKYYAIISKYSCQLETNRVEFESVQDSLFVPNIILPTIEDHGNAYLQVRGSELNDFNLMVMNRYGKEVFQTNDQHFKWSADDVSAGVYFWRATYLNCVSVLKEQKGWLQILK